MPDLFVVQCIPVEASPPNDQEALKYVLICRGGVEWFLFNVVTSFVIDNLRHIIIG